MRASVLENSNARILAQARERVVQLRTFLEINVHVLSSPYNNQMVAARLRVVLEAS